MRSDNQQPSLDLERTCRKCGQSRPLSDFQPYRPHPKTKPDLIYHRHECADCRRKYQAAWARGEVVPVEEDGLTRVCRECGERKPLEGFVTIYAQNSRGKQYKSHTCLECHRPKHAEKEMGRRAANRPKYRAAGRARWLADPVKAKAQRAATHQRLKAKVFEAYGGFKCVCCGETQPSMLNIDHIHENGGEHRRSLGLAKGWKKRRAGVDGATFYHHLRNEGFPPGYQVLCYNCNISKHRNGGVCAHKIKEGSTIIP